MAVTAEHRRRLAIVVAVVLATGCSASSDDAGESPDVTELDGTFGAETVEAAVGLLADAGVPVRVRPGDAPLVDVDVASPVELLRFQVRNLALEANRGGGTLGGDLDAYTEAAGGAPISYLIAGWAATGATVNARAAAELLGVTDSTEPPDLVIPGLVIAAFLGDMTRANAPRDEPVAAGWRASRPATAEDEGEDFCADVARYLSASLDRVLDPELTLEPQWLQAVIETYAPWEHDPQRIRTANGAIALMVYATSISRPWVPLLVANPRNFHHEDRDGPPSDFGDIGGEQNELRLSVDTGEGSFAEEAADCAALANVTLADHEVEGTSLAWADAALLPHIVRDRSGGELELDEHGNASYEYDPIAEPSEAHNDGILNTAVAGVQVLVMRSEVVEVRDVVKSLLTGGDLGVAAPEVQATYAKLENQLQHLLVPRALASVTVTWHTPKPPKPEQIRVPTGGCSSCARSVGDPHLTPLAGPAYDFQATGEYTLLRSTDGRAEIQVRQQPAGDSTTVAVNTAVAARVGDHRIGVYRHGEEIEVRIDGVVTELHEPVDLGDGANVAPYENGLQVTFPDGTVMWAVASEPSWIDVLVNPSDALRRDGRGLIGPAAEGQLPALPDGSALAAPYDTGAAYDVLYGEFAPAWRVTAESSLFDYAAGESPDTFLVPDFPSREMSYDDLTPDQLRIGYEACADVLPPFQELCVFDVAASGDPSFAETYIVTTNVVAEAAAGLGEPGPLTAAGPADAVAPVGPQGAPSAPQARGSAFTLTGALARVGSPDLGRADVAELLTGIVEARQGSVLIARAESCPTDASVWVWVRNLDDESSIPLDTAQLRVCAPGEAQPVEYFADGSRDFAGEDYAWLSADGDYEVAVETDAESAVEISVDIATDTSPLIVTGDDLVDGSSETLRGDADTAVYLVPRDISFDTNGLDQACSVDGWGLPELGSGDVVGLDSCGHLAEIADPVFIVEPDTSVDPAELVRPVITFSRSPDTIEIELHPRVADDEPTTSVESAAEPRAGEPTDILRGSLAGSSGAATDDDVVSQLRSRVRAEQGTVLVARTADCPSNARVSIAVTKVDGLLESSTYLCDPLVRRDDLPVEDDETSWGEAYVWLPAAGEYDVLIDTNARDATPITVELFTDPTPTIVSHDDVMTGGHAATLSGVGDTVVYDLDATFANPPALHVRGLDAACVISGYGTTLGSDYPWGVDTCDHLAPDEVPSIAERAPVVVFSRASDDIPIELTADR
jgi:hypothetical protein